MSRTYRTTEFGKKYRDGHQYEVNRYFCSGCEYCSRGKYFKNLYNIRQRAGKSKAIQEQI